MGLDGTTLIVEILDGDRYRTYHYWSPWDRQQPDTRNAAAIIELVGALMR